MSTLLVFVLVLGVRFSSVHSGLIRYALVNIQLFPRKCNYSAYSSSRVCVVGYKQVKVTKSHKEKDLGDVRAREQQ